MSLIRNCYVLTENIKSQRALFSKSILEKLGFNVTFFLSIPNKNRPLSNKNSMIAIYKLIQNGNDEWVYVFEDDINILQDIKMSEIIEYEKISQYSFFLGVCMYDHYKVNYDSTKVNNHEVAIVKGEVRGAHAVAFSKEGINKLLLFIENMSDCIHSDVILEKFTELYPAYVIRYDLESSIKGHRGLFFQDRTKFRSTM
jgi:hypothetical protein